ncbi:MAG TPA: condensation domain-containing protein, partial [Streptomyces sp.]|uniref:condensation domain-containing protein n=1 Tax=Streptomyces sp. TaxID=1931 RepID=UPI002D6ECA17
DVTAWQCRPGDGPGPVPIGRPIANTRILVLDRHLQPVPVGVPGELHIGGAGLARGYLDRPELTAERFVEDPFDPGARLYRTGDLARLREDGAVEFLGRLGRQVRIRGHRVEPAEVAAVMAGHERVRGAVVASAAGQETGDPRLVAYVGRDGTTGPDPDDLAAYAGERLPEYMVPSAFVVLPELPLTPEGRTDTAALPAPEPATATPGPARVEPRDELEQQVAAAWREILGVREVGVHDDFFDLGGHSLLMTRLAARLSSAHGLHVPLRELFDKPTVARMAAWIAERKAAGETAPDAIPTTDRGAGVPLSFAQEELCLHQPVDAEDAFHNATTVLRLTGDLDEDALRRSLDAIVARHDALRARFVSRPGQPPVQRIAADPGWPLVGVDLRDRDGATRDEELRRIVAEEQNRPFRIAEEQPVRATLIRLADDEHVLVQVMHHLVTDNWSYGVLFGELRELYTAHTAGREPGLPELPLSFPDFAAWQQRQLAEGALEEHMAYWRDQLRGLPLTLRFTAPAHQAAEVATGATRGFVLGAPVTESLKGVGREEGATLFMVLLAAYGVLLSAYSGSDDVPVDFPVAGRERPETEHLIGYFVNHLLVRADLSGSPTFRELVGRVRDRTLAAYAHQSAPLWALDGVVEPGHDPTGITFNLLNATLPALDLPGLRVAPMDLGLGSDYVFSEVVSDFEPSAVDLALIMREDDAGELRGMWLYALKRVDARAVAAMMRRWPYLLDLITADPDRDVGELRCRLREPYGPAAGAAPAETGQDRD